MVNKLLHPQEIETFYVIPTIRKHFAEAMLKQGLKQKDVAEIFGVTAATISQYMSEKRGNEVAFTDDVIAEITKAAQNIKDQHSYLLETQRVLKFIRTSKTICTIHKMFSDVPSNCDPDTIGCRTHARPNVKL
jgi:predicted transcriptional regulator